MRFESARRWHKTRLCDFLCSQGENLRELRNINTEKNKYNQRLDTNMKRKTLSKEEFQRMLKEVQADPNFKKEIRKFIDASMGIYKSE